MNFPPANLLAGLIIAILLTGCDDQIQGQRDQLQPDMQAKVASDCRDIEKVGSLPQLQRNLDRDITALLESASHAGRGWQSANQSRLNKVAAEIQSNIEKIKTLLKPEWNQQSLATSYKWKIPRRAYPQLLLDLQDPSFKILRVELMQVSSYGAIGIAPPGTQILISDNQEVEIRMPLPSSSYELCELTKALAVHVNVVFAFGGSSGAHEFILTVPESKGHL